MKFLPVTWNPESLLSLPLLLFIFFSSTPSILAPTEASNSPKDLVFVRTRSKVTGELELSNVTQKVTCYHYSWLGPKTQSTTSTNLLCTDDFTDDEPCFEPLIYTIGEGKENGPNTTALEELCSNTGECEPLCELTGGDMCIKLVYYKSADGGVESSHSFCGTVQGVLPEEGCHYQKNKDGKDVQACFCATDRCNTASRPFGLSRPLVVGVFVLILSLVKIFV